MSRKPRRETLDDSLQKGEYADDLRKFANNLTQLFFKGRRHFNGGAILQSEMISEFSQKTVLQTQFDDRCFDFLHEDCLPLIPVNPEYNESTVPWTVHSLIGLLSELKRLDIPKEFQPGLLLLYFKFCYGVQIPPPPLL